MLNQIAQLRALLAFDQNAHSAVGQLQQLHNRRSYADIVQIIFAGIILGRIKLRDEENFLVRRHRFFQRDDRLIPTHKQGNNHTGENNDIAQGQ